MIPNARKRILIVDDAPPVRLMLQAFLGKLGVRPEDVSMAEDGELGVAAFREKDPELVFVDIEMPKMGGEASATLMLTDRPDLKVVVMTGLEETDARVRQMRSWGAFAILPKPLRLEKVKAIMDLIEDEQNTVGRIR